MFEHIKKRIIKSLIEEIGCLDPTGLELIGHNVISLIENKQMIHHGINKDYQASGYTVDSFSTDSTIVGEYSTEKGYFEDKTPKTTPTFDKINNDINHAIGHKKPDGPSKIYLITNQEEPPSFRSKFNSTTLAQSLGKKIVIFDARELAKLIHEQSIATPSCADFYKQFFPGFSQDLDNYEYYGRVPARCEKHFSDPGIIDSIRKHYLQGQNTCVLHGLSGSGKTQAAIDFIYHAGQGFENCIWISGDDWKPDASLSAVQRTRGGAPINVAGLFNSAKTILVIDSVERTLDEAQFVDLASGFAKGGVVLATSQLASPGSALYLPIPALSKEVATKILGEDPMSASKLCEEFVNLCSFSPLILSTTRSIVEDQSIDRDGFYKEVLESPELISGPDGLSIMRRILARLELGARDALRKIANSGSPINDLNFLRSFIGINHCINLQRLSILMSTNTPGVMKVHDLVCVAAQDDINSTVLAEAIDEYIGKHQGDMKPSVLRQIHLSFRQIYDEHIRRGSRNPDWLTYAILQVEGEAKYDIHLQIHDKEITPDLSLASVLCIIDAKEVHSYTIKDGEERRTYYSQCAEAFNKAIGESSSSEVKAELLHHRGKALRRCGQYEEALECFNEFFTLKPEWQATHLQIALLGSIHGVAGDIKVKGEESMRVLLGGILQDASSVPLRVSLAAIARLRSYKKVGGELLPIPDDVKKLADIIAISALEGLDQFYEAFVSFTSIFGYRHSSCCVDLAEALPLMLAMPPELVDKKQWVSACEALTNTAKAAEWAGKKGLSSRISEASIKFADAVGASEELKSYDARAIAKAYINASLPEKALAAIAKVPGDSIDHWLLYRKSEAELAIGEKGEALNNAHEAYSSASKDPKAHSSISHYHDLLRRCYEAGGDISAALVEAKLALEKCKDDRYKQTLSDRIVVLEGLSS
jgi:tetratricopeptide (TPR) repeat protein